MFSISEMPSPSSMFSISEMPSPSSMFSAYASVSASVMLCRTMVNELIPQPIRNYLYTKICYLFKPHTPYLTLVIEESTGMNPNQVFDAASTYLCTIINPKTKRLKVSKSPKEKNLTLQLDKGENLVDFYKEIELHWKLVCAEQEQSNPRDVIAQRLEKHKYFELSFLKKHKDLIIASYLPFILEKAKAIKDEKKVLKMHTLSNSKYSFDGRKWESVNLEHPATFETLAMDLDLKNSIMEDLNRFLKRKDFYKRVGRAWKRGYLLYGPPGTGKSSLVAAMANYLKFDIYDLQLASIIHDSELRRLLLSTSNRSILVIEDIDCSIEIPERGFGDSGKKNKKQDHQDSTPSRAFLTLSGLLNFVDGLWSSCGDERIIIFTTNHKDRLDPALLRPGRMDMHIHMSYCTFHGFKVLASNYLEINDQHNLFGEIESLMKETEVTPAQVTEELMKSEVADIALEGVVKLLKRKKLEDDNCEGIKGKKLNANRNVKRQKVEIKRKVPVRISRRKGHNLRRIKLQ